MKLGQRWRNSLLLIALILIKFSAAQPLRCKAGCGKYGNCNLETGECVCPFGRSGEACEEDLLPACRRAVDAPGQTTSHTCSRTFIPANECPRQTPFIAAYCGHVNLKPCECIRQCREYLCQPDRDGYPVCDTAIDLKEDRVCFHRTSLGREQTVEVPAKDEEGVEYYRGYLEGDQVPISYE